MEENQDQVEIQPGSDRELSFLALAILPIAVGAIVGNAVGGKQKMQVGAAIGLGVALFMPAVVTKVYQRLGL